MMSSLGTINPEGSSTSNIESPPKPPTCAPQTRVKNPSSTFYYPTKSLDAYTAPKKQDFLTIPETIVGPAFCVQVGYVATGIRHIERAVAHVALINQSSEIIRNLYIKPEENVVSYLEKCTSLSEELVNKYGLKKDKAVQLILEALPDNAILVGHCPEKDLEALGLEKGKHFKELFDLRNIWKVWNPDFQTYTRFSLDHLVKTVLNVAASDKEQNAVLAGVHCIQLWNNYLWCREEGRQDNLQAIRRHIIESPRIPSFEDRTKVVDGVCLGAKRGCVCGVGVQSPGQMKPSNQFSTSVT